MPKFRKKPVVVEAMRLTKDNYNIIKDWIGKKSFCLHRDEKTSFPLAVVVKTLEGDMYARVGDWIIKGVEGEFYPCKPDIFEKTYEKVDD